MRIVWRHAMRNHTCPREKNIAAYFMQHI